MRLDAAHGSAVGRQLAKLFAWRSGLKASVHAMLAKQGLHLRVSDLFGVGGRQLLATAPLDAAYRLRVYVLCQLIDPLDFELQAVSGPLRIALAGDRGFAPVPAVPRVEPVLAAIFVAEIGDVHRFTNAAHLASPGRTGGGVEPGQDEGDRRGEGQDRPVNRTTARFRQLRATGADRGV